MARLWFVDWIVQGDIEAGRVEWLMQDYYPLAHSVSIVYAQTRFLSRRARSFIDFVSGERHAVWRCATWTLRGCESLFAFERERALSQTIYVIAPVIASRLFKGSDRLLYSADSNLAID